MGGWGGGHVDCIQGLRKLGQLGKGRWEWGDGGGGHVDCIQGLCKLGQLRLT